MAPPDVTVVVATYNTMPNQKQTLDTFYTGGQHGYIDYPAATLRQAA